MQDQKDFEKYNSKENGYYGVGEFVIEIVKIVVLAFIIIVPIRVFLFQPFFVQGASMEPNFEDNQYLIVNEFGYKMTDVGVGNNSYFTVKPFKRIDRQKVVVFRYPLDPEKYYIKRIIGLPGERVEIKNGDVIIYNGQNPQGFVLNEKEYLSSSIRTTTSSDSFSMELKNNEYFVMGDNRMFSSDSRMWGPVPEKDIMGVVMLRAWPINKISMF
jgi:signal peptidase I